MTRRRMTVTAEDSVTARANAAEAFGVKPEGVAVRHLNSSSYEAFIEPLGFRILADEMSARVEICYVSEPLSMEELRESLQRAEISYGFDERAMADVCACLACGDNPVGLVVANGMSPTPGVPSRLEICGKPAFPYFPGMVVARVKEPVPPGPGWNVRGEEVAPPEIVQKSVAPRPGIGTRLSKTGQEVLATVYGAVRVVGDKVLVEPLYEVSPDMLSLTVTLYPRDSAGQTITVERIEQALAQDGFVFGFDANALAEALVTLSKKTKGEDFLSVVAMRGDPPVDGVDASAEMLFRKDIGIGSQVGERVDFHERNSVRNVLKGQELVRVTPASSSIPGKNVRGEAIPGIDGAGPPFQAGENIEVSSDGTLLSAGIDGMVVIANGLLWVTDCMEIRGDVDYRVGNLHIKKGSVSITGSVRDTFCIEAAGNVIVGDTIEAAQIKAGGDVDVARGVIMRDHGSIRAAGHVTALFVENAFIESVGDVIIKNDIINSRILTKGRILATEGRGKVVGGELHAEHGIEVNSIGASGGTGVLVCVGSEPEERQLLRKEREELYGSIEKIERVIGTADPLTILKRTVPAKRVLIAKLLKVKFAGLGRVKQIEARLQEMAEEIQRSSAVSVVVHKVLHAGVTVRIAEKELTIETDISSCVIRYDMRQERLVVDPLES